MDIVFLEEFRLELLIGIHAWERRVPQTVLLDIEIGLPDGRAFVTGHIADTLDYGAVAARIRQVPGEKNFLLVETLAEHIAALIRIEFGAPWVRVSVAKFGALCGVKKVGVVIERGERT